MPRKKYPKKKSKLDIAYRDSQRNKKILHTALEFTQATTINSTDDFVATTRVDHLPATGTGTKTKMTSVSVRGTIKQDLASAIIDDYRVDLVLDRTPDGAEVTPLVLYGSATPGIGAYKNILYKERFKILRSHIGCFDESQQGRSSDVINWYVKLNLNAISNTDNSFIQANIQRNAIYLIYWSTSVDNEPIPNLYSRVICKDSG